MTRAASAAVLAGLVLSLAACGGEGLSASGADRPTPPRLRPAGGPAAVP